jgi:flagellar protein FliT
VEEHVLSGYRRVAELSTQMLAAARRGDWDALVDVERCCRTEIDALRALGEHPLTPAEREEKQRILLRLLADDAEIRDLAQPRMKRLQDMLAAAGNARRLRASYGGPP